MRQNAKHKPASLFSAVPVLVAAACGEEGFSGGGARFAFLQASWHFDRLCARKHPGFRILSRVRQAIVLRAVLMYLHTFFSYRKDVCTKH